MHSRSVSERELSQLAAAISSQIPCDDFQSSSVISERCGLRQAALRIASVRRFRLLLDELQAERILVILAVVGLDARDDDEDQIGKANQWKQQGYDEAEVDERQHNRRNHAGDPHNEHRNLKIQRRLAMDVHRGEFILLDLPDQQCANTRNAWHQTAQVAQHVPHAGLAFVGTGEVGAGWVGGGVWVGGV